MISAAQLLDELMGRDRNLAPDEKRSNVRWDHESVCKYYLCGFCPAELFTNTRSDLGPCEKIHDENLRKQYEKSSRFMKVGYEREFLRYLQSLLAEVERRIRRGHARLALSQTQQSSGQAAGPTGKNEEKIQVLTDKIDVLLQQIEELGSEGKVEEAQGMMKLVEQLKEERELLRSTTSTIESFAAQEKQMEVCEVCGAFLIVGDAQSRVDDHLMGKQHMGYAKIKATVEELKEKLRKRTEEPERDDRLKKEKLEREEREREREREEKERKRRREEEEKEKERARDRERRKRSRSRSRHSSRTSDRRGSRSRDHKRSRSKERRRSRSRDRRRSRSHDRSDRKHRSRSRDRRRSKSRDRKSYKHRSKSREREQERKSKEKEKRGSDDKKSSVKSSSREKQSEDTSMDSKEGDAKNEVNGTSEDIKSEVQRKYVQMKMDLRQVRRDTKATSEGKHSVVLQNLLRYIVLYRLFCSRFISPLACLLGTYL
ncbi:PREDICTED: luc7-like protein 3 isoform X3 [Thamnophis sirtalis]|uniref:Luc7-like protein 3 isoform X3 n=1 Tax=Thamnophis sirtalis TaxID=35019 RepID=A0A6I9XDC3_9SAUR|nr:PREDICTED: luc7-like protein 3 isoform X3 [Thamnophis sirtalis]XP_032065133.1 luc7-like protein 3 isoform X3 [Thamnophis elegans]